MVDLFTANLFCAHELCLPQEPQVFADGWLANVRQTRYQIASAQRSLRAQEIQDEAPIRVGNGLIGTIRQITPFFLS